MKTKITNVTFVAVLILAFSVYVAGLNDSARAGDAETVAAVGSEPAGEAPASGGERAVRAEATPTRTPTPVNIGNFVWSDLDSDGRQDAGEPGIQGVTVQLWNPAKTALIDSTTTNASGNYTVVAPMPGQYRVRVVLPNAADAFSPKDQAAGNDQLDSDINPTGVNFGFTDTITIASNVISTTTTDAGIIRFMTPTPTRTPTPVNIGNFVWSDLDSDGRQDAGEPGLAGVTVQLWNPAKTSLIHSTVTNSSGIYTVVAPTPGQYRVRVVLPNAADMFSPKNQAGGDDQLDSDINPTGANFGFTDIITIASNVISTTTTDAGIIRFMTPTPTRTPTPINIGNFVWHDLDEDGRQDAGEPGIPGVTVQLWNSTKTALLDSTVTNSNGIYTVVAPIPGTYRVRVLLPSGAGFSPKGVGADTQDSNINPTGVDFGFTDIITIASNVISLTSVDAGIIDYEPPAATTSSSSSSTSTTTTTTTTTAPGSSSTTTTTGGGTSSTTTTTDGSASSSTTTTAVGETTTTASGPSTTLPGIDGPPDAFYLEGGQLTKAKTASPGEPVTLTLGGAAPGSTVDVILYSDPVQLGAATAGADGTFVEPFTIPAGTALGAHEISLVGETAAGEAFDLRLDLTVVAPGGPGTGTTNPTGVSSGDLARTGTEDTDRLVAIGLTLLGLGGVIVALRRRASGRPA